MGPYILELAKRFEITLVTNGTAQELASLLSPRVRFESIDIRRQIAPFRDLSSFGSLWGIFRRNRFAVVHSMMPKSGLLSMTAAALAGVPVRVHCFTGQTWATRKGAARWLLKTMDRLLAACATHLFTDSPSQREFLAAEGIVPTNRVVVLGQGSVCGVDATRFSPNPAFRTQLRARMGVPESAVVALYLGRLNPDKGIPDLAHAFSIAARDCPDLHLLLVGPDESRMQEIVTQKLVDLRNRLHFSDATSEPEVFMAAADFFVSASHREGFGSAIIEAAACGIPAIGTRIYGLTDAIVDGETGLLVPVRDSDALATAMIKLANDRFLRSALGSKALMRVQREFRQEQFTAALTRFYDAVCPAA